MLLLTMPLAQASEYQILISKKNNELIVEKAGEVVKKYHIATFLNGIANMQAVGYAKIIFSNNKFTILNYIDECLFCVFFINLV